MRTCEYCGLNTDSQEHGCPYCGAPLPLLKSRNAYYGTGHGSPYGTGHGSSYGPSQPQDDIENIFSSAFGPTTGFDTSTKKTRKNRIFILWVFVALIAIVFISAKYNNFIGKRNFWETPISAPAATSAPLNPDNPDNPDHPANRPETVEQAMAPNPALRQIIELYLGKDIGRIKWVDLEPIQFLFISGNVAYLSNQPLQTPSYTDGALDWPETVAISYDAQWQNNESLAYLTGLKTFAVLGTDGTAKSLPPMGQLERLAIYSGTRADDFTEFNKFPNLIELSVSGSRLTSFNGLSAFTRLEKLGLIDTGLTDLGPLSGMGGLKSLTLYRNREMQSIRTLEGMTWLTEYVIDGAEFNDLSAIAKLTRLERLTVSKTKTKSLSFLNGLSELKYLKLTDNSEIIAIPPLSGLPKLEEIHIDCSKTEDMSFLSGLSGVRKATLTGASSVEPLSSFASLQYLWLDINYRLDDVSALGQLSELQYLRIVGKSYREVAGVESLGGLSKLKELDFSGNESYIKYDFVYGLTSLERLNLSKNTIFGDFSGIGRLTNLRELNLNNVKIHEDFEMVRGGNGMTSIYYTDQQPFDDFAAQLANLALLEILRIDKNELTDLSFVSSMPNLRILSASDNYIADVSPLANLTNLEEADLSKNAVEDWRALDSMINTKITQ